MVFSSPQQSVGRMTNIKLSVWLKSSRSKPCILSCREFQPPRNSTATITKNTRTTGYAHCKPCTWKFVHHVTQLFIKPQPPCTCSMEPFKLCLHIVWLYYASKRTNALFDHKYNSFFVFVFFGFIFIFQATARMCSDKDKQQFQPVFFPIDMELFHINILIIYKLVLLCMLYFDCPTMSCFHLFFYILFKNKSNPKVSSNKKIYKCQYI